MSIYGWPGSWHQLLQLWVWFTTEGWSQTLPPPLCWWMCLSSSYSQPGGAECRRPTISFSPFSLTACLRQPIIKSHRVNAALIYFHQHAANRHTSGGWREEVKFGSLLLRCQLYVSTQRVLLGRDYRFLAAKAGTIRPVSKCSSAVGSWLAQITATQPSSISAANVLFQPCGSSFQMMRGTLDSSSCQSKQHEVESAMTPLCRVGSH